MVVSAIPAEDMHFTAGSPSTPYLVISPPQRVQLQGSRHSVAEDCGSKGGRVCPRQAGLFCRRLGSKQSVPGRESSETRQRASEAEPCQVAGLPRTSSEHM